jgi:hypothetical protein
MRAIAVLVRASVILALSACSAPIADPRVNLAGYQDYKFGMPEADLRAMINIAREVRVPNMPGRHWLYTQDTISIDDKTYELSFRLQDGLLAG